MVKKSKTTKKKTASKAKKKITRRPRKTRLDQVLLDSSIKSLNQVKKRLKKAKSDLHLDSDMSHLLIESMLERAKDIQKSIGVQRLQATKKKVAKKVSSLSRRAKTKAQGLKRSLKEKTTKRTSTKKKANKKR